MPAPLPTGIFHVTGQQVASQEAASNTFNILHAKYMDSMSWAAYAAGILEDKLNTINIALQNGPADVDAFMQAATDAINAIPDIVQTNITFTPQTEPVYNSNTTYTSPAKPTLDDVTYVPVDVPTDYQAIVMGAVPDATVETVAYNAPTEPTYSDVVYNAPSVPTFITPQFTAPASPTLEAITFETQTPVSYENIAFTAPDETPLLDIPTPTKYAAGAAPSTDIILDNSSFSNALLDNLTTKLTQDLATSSTGLGSAEAALFARAVARENDVLLESYDQIASNFSSRGFDLPPGAIDALRAQESNKSTIRLTDINASIMAESAKLAQTWNQVTVDASARVTDILARIFDSKLMRQFEAAKVSVTLALEGFKASIQVLSSNAQLEGQYISSVASVNDSITRAYTAKINAEIARLNGVVELNKGRVAEFNSKVQGFIAEMSGKSEFNKAKIAEFSSEIQGMLAKLSGESELNKAFASQYDALSKGELNRLSGVIESNKAMLQRFMGQVQGEIARMGAITDANKGRLANYSALVQAEVAKLSGIVETNKAITSRYTSEISGRVAEVNAKAESNKSKLGAFSAEIQSETQKVVSAIESNKQLTMAYGERIKAEAAHVSAQGEQARANAMTAEVSIKKGLGVADIASKLALSHIEAATRKYLGEIGVMQGVAQQTAQMVASALNGLSASTSYGFSGSVSESEDTNVSKGDIKKAASVSYQPAPATVVPDILKSGARRT